MLYLSEVLQKPVVAADSQSSFDGKNKKSFGKVIDLVVSESRQDPVIAKIVVKRKGVRLYLPADNVNFTDKQWILKATTITSLPRNNGDFYLAEDLMDKQVIDINGRRLVRVNDVLLKSNGGLKVEAIDIGLSGILRRLGFNFPQMHTITLPWSLIEAFDYQTGSIQLKLTQSKLNTFHPAEIADMLEEAGAKERVGLVTALDAKKAASAISKTDTETQTAILEQVPSTNLKQILAKMHSSTIADVVDRLNPFTSSKIFNTLESEKAKKVKKLLIFEDDVAGGLMDFTFYKAPGTQTVSQTLSALSENEIRPEAIVLVNEEGKIMGTLTTKTLINRNGDKQLKELIKQRVYVYEDAPFSRILRLFAEYNARLLPVVDKHKFVIGVISIETLLAKIHEEEEKEDAL